MTGRTKLTVVLSLLALAAYSEIPLPEYRETTAAKGAESLVFSADGKVKTGRFHVQAKMDANVFGQMNAAESKYVVNAATAEMTLTDGKLDIVVDCPVPAGDTIDVQEHPWNGDYVEVDIRANVGDPRFLCYYMNANGDHSGTEFGAKRPGWRTKSKLVYAKTDAGYRVTMSIPVAEVFDAPPKPGDTFGINFIRVGRTCGGHSAWATVGGAYNDSKYAFGTVVIGGAEAFFRRRLADMRTKAAESFSDAAAKKLAEEACQCVEEAIVRHAAEPNAFASLERMFTALDETFLAISLQGRPQLVYVPDDPWANEIRPRFGTKPLTFFRLKAPRNTRRVQPLAVANFGDEVMLCNLKFFDRYDSFYQTGSRRPPPERTIAPNFTLRRSLVVYDKADRPLYDPLVELPLGSTLEVPPHRSTLVFAELDTHGARPGRYELELKLRSATPGYADVDMKAEVTVTDDDLDVLPADKMGFTHLVTAYGAEGKTVRPTPNCIRRLVERDYNVILLTRFDDMYPVCDSNKVWHAPSYERMDGYIDAWLAGGLDPKRMKLEPYIGVERERPAYHGFRDHTGRRFPFGSPEHDAGIRAMVKFFAEHVKAKYGVGKDRIIWYPVDEANTRYTDPAFKSRTTRNVHAGRLIREQDPANIILWNPVPPFSESRELFENREELVRIFDIIDVYWPKLSERGLRDVKASGYRKVWSSHISSRGTSASFYRALNWRNMREGFSEVVDYWHLDESSALDPRPVHPYGTCYLDRDLDQLILSRRQLAADMAYDESRLVNYLRMKYRDDPAKLAGIDALVKKAADAGTMAAMDLALEKLLALLD